MGSIYIGSEKTAYEVFYACAQPMRDDVTMLRRLSLAGRIHKMIPESIEMFLASPSHYPNQYWLIVGTVVWHSPENHCTVDAQTTIIWLGIGFEIYIYEITITVVVEVLLTIRSHFDSYVTISYISHGPMSSHSVYRHDIAQVSWHMGYNLD